MAESGGSLRELLATFGFDVDVSELKKAEGDLSDFLKKVKTVGEGLLAAVGFHAIKEWTNETVNSIMEVEHAATRLGISTDRVQEFQYAAEGLGMESGQLLNLMGRLQVAQQGAATGAGKGGNAFRALGVNVKDSSGHFKAADELMLDVAEGISKVKDPSKQAALAVGIFGRSGREILPFLKEGREGFEKLTDKFQELGGGRSKEAIESAKQYKRAIADLNLALRSGAVAGFLNIITKIITVMTKAVVGLHNFIQGSNLFTSMLVVAGGAVLVFAGTLWAMVAPLLAAAAPVVLLGAAIAGLVLLVDDIIGLFQGKDSEIGRFIDTLFGKGASTATVEKLKILWESIVESYKEAVHWINEMIDKVALLYDTMSKFNLSKLGASLTGNAAQLTPDEARAHAASLNALNVTDNSTTHITVHAPGANEQVGEHVAKAHDQLTKQRHREAMATRHRKVAQ